MFETLKTMANNYGTFKPQTLTGKVNLKIDDQWFNLEMTADSTNAHEGKTEGELATFAMSEETFNKIVDGTWTGLTAAGREHIMHPAPVNFHLPPGTQLTPQFMQMIYHMGMHLFKAEIPHVYKFGLENSRNIHGGNAVALAYGPGVRFAYYTISGEEQINDENTRDPMEQMLTIIGGKGTAWIEGVEVPLHKGVAVYVPSQATHVVKAAPGEQLELVWLAYGRGA